MFTKGMVVQFIEKHKWAGIITEVKEPGADVRYIPIPQQGTAYIFSMESDEEFELITGFAKLVPRETVLGVKRSNIKKYTSGYHLYFCTECYNKIGK